MVGRGREMTDPFAAQPLWVGDIELRVAPLGGYDIPDHLVIVKAIEVLDAYRDLLARFDRPSMVELGIAYGGSVSFFALVADPTRLVAIEMASERVPLLDRLIEERGLGDRVSLHYGIDQADRRRVGAIVASEFEGEPIDLVIDDASHLYDETVASFETLFPHLRPGGEYIIEDWSCDHGIRALIAAALADPDSPLNGWAQQVVAGEVLSAHPGQQAQTAIAVASLGQAGGGRVQQTSRCRVSACSSCWQRPSRARASSRSPRGRSGCRSDADRTIWIRRPSRSNPRSLITSERCRRSARARHPVADLS